MFGVTRFCCVSMFFRCLNSVSYKGLSRWLDFGWGDGAIWLLEGSSLTSVKIIDFQNDSRRLTGCSFGSGMESRESPAKLR